MASSAFDLQQPWQQNTFHLDRRLVKGLSKLGYVYPTLVQAQTIPLALQGKDILVRARTGSGKTVAFAVPCLQKLLQQKNGDDKASGVQCIILAPTKELIKQIAKNITDLIYYCRDSVSILTIADDNVNLLDYRSRTAPDIVLATPAKLMQALKGNHLDLAQVQMLVLDEADLVLSYGYKDDLHKITSRMPKIFQGILVSATLSTELEKFKRLLLHKPVVLKLEEAQSVSNLMQFYLPATEEDKFLTLYVFLKLGILQGKGLIFVNDVNKCYKVKLFLQQFFISAAVLNAEIPLNSRTHILEEFNRGVFDYLIATDASVDTGEDDESDSEDEGTGEQLGDEEDIAEGQDEDAGEDDNDVDDDANWEDEEEEGEEEGEEETSPAPVKQAKRKPQAAAKGDEEEYGVSRGIDFQAVNFVVNFDFPVTSAAYIHRIGRTARGMSAAGTVNAGLALSFVLDGSAPSEEAAAEQQMEMLVDIQSRQPRMGALENDHVFAALHNAVDADDDQAGLQPAMLTFNREELESFRYRVQDVYRSVTRVAVREFRVAELRRELLHSQSLQTYFQENPDDLKVLRHDKAVLHPIRQKDHLKFVPDYLIPQSMRTLTVQTKGKNNKRNRRSALKRKEHGPANSRSKDPLFNASALDADGGDDDEEEGTRDDDQDDDDQEEDDEESPRVGAEDAKLRNTVSGRKRWKMNHRKGDFNPHNNKRKESRTPGTFLTSRKY